MDGCTLLPVLPSAQVTRGLGLIDMTFDKIATFGLEEFFLRNSYKFFHSRVAPLGSLPFEPNDPVDFDLLICRSGVRNMLFMLRCILPISVR